MRTLRNLRKRCRKLPWARVLFVLWASAVLALGVANHMTPAKPMVCAAAAPGLVLCVDPSYMR